MSCCSLFFRPAALALAALILAAGSSWAQTTATPAAPFVSPAFNSPISPFLFGPPAYPFRATAPSSTTPAPSAAQISSGISHPPSLSATPTPLSLAPPPPASTHSQPAIGPFIASSLMGADAAALLPGSDYRPAADNRGHIWLRVPADAQVWFGGRATTQTGTSRLYHTPELTPGKKYHYELRIRWTKDGKPVEEKRRIEVEARDWLRFDLTRPSAP